MGQSNDLCCAVVWNNQWPMEWHLYRCTSFKIFTHNMLYLCEMYSPGRWYFFLPIFCRKKYSVYCHQSRVPWRVLRKRETLQKTAFLPLSNFPSTLWTSDMNGCRSNRTELSGEPSCKFSICTIYRAIIIRGFCFDWLQNLYSVLTPLLPSSYSMEFSNDKTPLFPLYQWGV